MTHTIELPLSVEQVLEDKARRRNLSLEHYLRELAERDAQAPDDATQRNGEQAGSNPKPLTPQQQAVLRGYGMCAGRSHTIDDFLRERHEEGEREEAETQRRIAERRARGIEAHDEHSVL